MLQHLRTRTSAHYSRVRYTPALMAFTALAAACVACGGQPDGSGVNAKAKAGGELVWAKTAEADVLDPTLSGTAASWEHLDLTYEQLVGLDGNLKPIPELAESWQQTSPTTYVFNLRKGVKFSNGREMTVDDVIGSLNRIMDPKVAANWSSQLGIADAEAIGSSQVRITLSKPRTSFVPALAGMPAAILPMRELNAGTYDPKKEMLGTGPFKANAHSQNESWSFARNLHYWRPGLPKADKLTVRIMPDDSTRVAALRDGSIDITTFETPDTIRLLKAEKNVKVVVQSTTDFYRMDVNAKSSIFADERLRQAVSLSIDRNRIRDIALGGIGRPTAVVSVAFTGVCDPAAVPFAAPDVQRARELVEAAGATGKTVEIGTVSNVPMSTPIAQVLQENLEQAGFKVRILKLELGQAV